MTLVRAAWHEARLAVHAEASSRSRSVEWVPLDEAVSRTLARPVSAAGPVPGFDMSAMDGWAVVGEGPWTVGAPLVAGSTPEDRALHPGEARPITTGAPVPRGTDRVLRSESGRVSDGLLYAASEPPAPPRHIRRAGEEAAAGDELFAAGTVLTPPRVAVAAVCGLDTLPVVVRPRAVLAVLGDEVVGSGVPLPGQVRDVFSVPVPSILRLWGAESVSADRVQDDLEATISALDRLDADVVVTTGGTAHGSTDHVRTALNRIGAELVVDRVAMRPGQPLLVARRNTTLYLCLPGNPMAAMVALAMVGAPLIEGLLGRPATRPTRVSLAADIAHPRPGVLVQAYRSSARGAEVVPRQSSAMLRGLADADGLLVVPEGGAAAGETVAAVRLPW